MTVKAKGAIAAGHPETARAAAIILEEGGNAFDAVIGGVMAACIAEPVLASLGGGGFCLASPPDGSTVVYDFFTQTPKRRPDDLDFFPIIADFGTAQQEFHIGMGSIATPGVVAGLFALHRDRGHMPLQRIAEPAIRLARTGVKMNATQAYIFQIVKAIYLSNDTCAPLFGSRETPGQPLGEGEVFALPDFAGTLETLTREGEDFFYKGDIASAVARDCRDGGCLGLDDFEGYDVIRRAPLGFAYGPARIEINPPPSTGGLLIAFALNLLADHDLAAAGFGSARHLGLLVQAMKLTNRARVEAALHEMPPDDMVATWLDADFLARYRAEVAGHPPCHRGTTHISIIDGDGNAAALTLSNGEGAAYIVPGTGIMMNNMLGEEDINPHGYNLWPPDRRMSSMMAPMLIRSEDGRRTVLGSGGSNRIRTALLQATLNLVSFEMPLNEAVAAPRLHVEGARISIEGGFEDQAFSALGDGEREIWADRNFFFGGVHAVSHHPDRETFEGAGDLRRGGVALRL